MPAPLRVVLAGTPQFAVPCLHACRRADVQIVAVYTQPDRRAGRGRQLSACPVKQAALEAGIPVEQPSTLKDPAAQARLAAFAPDLMIVVAYGQILPQALLDTPRHGCWNVHASLLPRWRGAAPIERAIAAGDSETGVCLMRMDAGLDTGPILLRQRAAIHATDTGGSLRERLAELGAALLGEGLERLLAGRLPAPVPQAETGVTYAHKLDKAESALVADAPAVELARIVRAFDPWPGSTLAIAGERVRIWEAEALPDATTPAPVGSIVATSAEGIDIACQPGILRIQAVQRAGGRRISASDYINARPALRTKAKK